MENNDIINLIKIMNEKENSKTNARVKCQKGIAKSQYSELYSKLNDGEDQLLIRLYGDALRSAEQGWEYVCLLYMNDNDTKETMYRLISLMREYHFKKFYFSGAHLSYNNLMIMLSAICNDEKCRIEGTANIVSCAGYGQGVLLISL